MKQTMTIGVPSIRRWLARGIPPLWRRTIPCLALATILLATIAVSQDQLSERQTSSVPTTVTWPALDVPADLGPDEELIARLEPLRNQHGLPGLIGAIIHDRQLLAIGAVGRRKIDSPHPLTIHDKIHLGSCTKAMTATMIASLVESNRLTWDASIDDQFPELHRSLHGDFRQVTVEQLLTHTGGVPRDGPWSELGLDASTTVQRQRLLLRICGSQPQATPGTNYLYSNVGYMLAGLLAEKSSGLSWERLMRETVFEPLGMDSAGFGAPGTPGAVDQPWGHRLLDDHLLPNQSDNIPALGPAGTVHCSMADWARFVAFHLQGARSDPQFLAAETFARMHTPAAGRNYAHGWQVTRRDWADGPVLTHSGSNRSWKAVVWIAPQRNFAVLAAANCGGDHAVKGCDAAAAALIAYHRQMGASPREGG
jgi:CubicO group peptidase (beta-lactamase class C family)